MHSARRWTVTLSIIALLGCSNGAPGLPDGAVDASVPRDARPPVDAGFDGSSQGVDASVTTDAGAPDADTPDAGAPDAGTPDAGAPDASTPDAGTPDASTPDAGAPDAGTPDAGTPDAGPPLPDTCTSSGECGATASCDTTLTPARCVCDAGHAPCASGCCEVSLAREVTLPENGHAPELGFDAAGNVYVLYVVGSTSVRLAQIAPDDTTTITPVGTSSGERDAYDSRGRARRNRLRRHPRRFSARAAATWSSTHARPARRRSRRWGSPPRAVPASHTTRRLAFRVRAEATSTPRSRSGAATARWACTSRASTRRSACGPRSLRS